MVVLVWNYFTITKNSPLLPILQESIHLSWSSGSWLFTTIMHTSWRLHHFPAIKSNSSKPRKVTCFIICCMTLLCLHLHWAHLQISISMFVYCVGMCVVFVCVWCVWHLFEPWLLSWYHGIGSVPEWMLWETRWCHSGSWATRMLSKDTPTHVKTIPTTCCCCYLSL